MSSAVHAGTALLRALQCSLDWRSCKNAIHNVYRRSQRFIERVFAAISGSRHYYRAARYVVQLISAVHAGTAFLRA